MLIINLKTGKVTISVSDTILEGVKEYLKTRGSQFLDGYISQFLPYGSPNSPAGTGVTYRVKE